MNVCIYFYIGMSDSGTACTLTTEQQFGVHVVRDSLTTLR